MLGNQSIRVITLFHEPNDFSGFWAECLLVLLEGGDHTPQADEFRRALFAAAEVILEGRLLHWRKGVFQVKQQ